ncbi:MAG: tRNA (adenosine(37)-N6)-dimethylallyltransferase MiaA [Acidobacteriota bacterium]|nr:tRNA (adenosine(37)-N6)-dimethylallyltransferase MiaA [Acidobacteriota bacterium]MDH3524653.1 tRNA (adenosine(37)-N6)-dimethylallyltransferase MiaA [Acidobacteriota bacterium]
MSGRDARAGAIGTLIVLGPTAAGKSALALALADHYPIEIVNGDSLQAYRGLDVGTAKPGAAERARVPHHLIDILDPSEPFSAGEFRRRALPVIEEIRARGRLPVVVGGSGFYLRALTAGLSAIPPVPGALRREVAALLRREGLPAVRRRLASLDPETAARVAADDPQRTLRALEVVLATGRGLADWWRREPPRAELEVLGRIGLTLPRALLYDRIARRLATMVADGWVEEVVGLLAGGCLPTMPAFQAIGYRQLVRHIRGEWSLERSLEETARETRRFAKRQLTWFRREPDVDWIEGRSLAEALPRALEAISRRIGGVE